jgi:hypothetical protein
VSRGLLDFVGLAVTTAFAIPIFLAAISFLTDDQPVIGGALLGIVVLMFLFEEYVTSPLDLPGEVAQRTVGAVAEDPDSDEE